MATGRILAEGISPSDRSLYDLAKAADVRLSHVSGATEAAAGADTQAPLGTNLQSGILPAMTLAPWPLGHGHGHRVGHPWPTAREANFCGISASYVTSKDHLTR